MQPSTQDLSRLLDAIVEHLDVPKSHYEKAAARHRSLGEWLQRKESRLAPFDPDVRPQGSFRYGTVVRPMREGEAYDLDNVCLFKRLGKTVFTQKRVKELYGEEVKAYAKANNMLAPVTEHNRCWRLQYADEVEFHLDTLPCVSEEEAVVHRLVAAGVPLELARRAVAITDKRHPQYDVITSVWLSSNPRGFAAWFEQRAALGRRRPLMESKTRAAVEDVPPYEWKTTLQRSIQILKRHRDVMFLDRPELAPISMIITNLAARAYGGELDVAVALRNIVDKMPSFVRSERPRVSNPADPTEDYADKWARDPRLERSFWDWHYAVSTDLAKLPGFLRGTSLKADIRKVFRVDLTQDEVRRFQPLQVPAVTVVRAAPSLIVPSAPKPWGSDA